MISIIKKEVRTYFTSMSGYIFLGFMTLLTGIMFSVVNVLNMSPAFQNTLSSASIMYLILIPVLTMRLFAEEARQKTDQLLYTSPLTVNQIVIGKFLAAFLLLVAGMLITLIFPIMISPYGELPTAVITGAILGYTLLGACFIAVGLFVSSLTENQIIAAVATFAALFIFFIMNGLITAVPSDRTASIFFIAIVIVGLAFVVFDSTKNIFAGIITGVVGAGGAIAAFLVNNFVFDGVIAKVLQWFSLLSRFNNFQSGILNVADIVYYLTFAAAFVYLTINVIEKRRWK